MQHNSPALLSQTTVHQISKKKYIPTEPISVALLKKQNIKTPHRIIGTVQVSNYNLVGVKRQLVSIHDLMQQEAASIGGNAVIIIKQTDKETTGDIVRFMS
ncbi:MAG: hypothetical protein A3C55_05515 [Gammaproteobacteria bacterium RIFCSPHIGHO2_02_FULL_42_13]|nr:MAG: hypothetical protein A3C55_05515 [Gammaproteobacteria bacterium RIFCSPHIGHO2_02_FULL_42_13]OGT68670.1 MAG: hypothetical protein A3H43_01510 [Gammaproteobacteria bacterium RIFCSPLOWO2_02_FULL_42_9]